MPTIYRSALALAFVAAIGGDARADDVPAPPAAPRVLHVPTANLQPVGRFHGTAGIDHSAATFLAVTYGLGGLADVDIEVDDGFATAAFKLGARQGLIARWQPAVALLFRKSFSGQDRQLARMQLASSLDLGPVRLHGGASMWSDPLDVRPFAALEWRPWIYPRTTLLADLDFTRAVGDDSANASPALRAGWGIRYQALSWGSIELAVRHRTDEEIGESNVLIRVNGIWPRP